VDEWSLSSKTGEPIQRNEAKMEIRLSPLATLLFPMLLLVGCSTNPSASSPAASTPSAAQVDLGADPLPSWNKGPAKQAIISFVKTTTDKANPQFVQPEDRIATFDQDGTT
jgi:hypothetical protein